MYNLFPEIQITKEKKVVSGYTDIFSVIKDNQSIVIETYVGCDLEQLTSKLKTDFSDYKLIFIDDYSFDQEKIQHMNKKYITEDRVFGYMSNHVITDFYDETEIEKLKNELKNSKYIVYGFGAVQFINEADISLYFNINRWEIQKNYRKGMTNWKVDNNDDEVTKKFKRGYFFEWRIADRIKKQYLNKFDYVADFNNPDNPKMIDYFTYRNAITTATTKPFRLVPYFDAGVWGGHWMKDKFNLAENGSNYAWAFDGVVEENSVRYVFADEYIDMPAIDIVFFEPVKLLGNKVHARFGTEFPIRFDFLDTIGGQNLSLQVHPLTEYIQEKFGMNYTQDESYYILDTDPSVEPEVYIGVKDGVSKKKLFSALENAQETNKFDHGKYINSFKVKKHDHILIPAGTIHCSGAGTMVLEISATPYIFTFKLWDWDRLGTNGLPRPIHLKHGKENVCIERDTTFVKKELFNNFERLSDTEEKTGLHEREFIETKRYFSQNEIVHQTEGSVNMLNIIEGEGAIVSSIDGQFDDFIVNYAETFIIPEHVKEYIIKPINEKQIGYIKAHVK